ncbi:hypothetical protein Ancab_002437 [Ancistrocladus abbreviatus]
MAALEEVGEAAPPLVVGLVVALMLGLVTGIALLETVVLITLPAAQAASSVAPTRRNLVADTVVTCHALENLALVVVVAAVTVATLDGNPVTGFAPDMDAMSTTLPAEWSVSDAMHQGIPAANLYTDFSHFQI